MSKRLKEIDDMLNNFFPNNSINNLFDKYKFELDGYKYIDNVNDFSILPLKGSLKYINKYTKELRYGGLLIKIYSFNNQWIAMIKKMNNRIYHINFNKNYIFYCENKDTILNDWANCFIKSVDNGEFDII